MITLRWGSLVLLATIAAGCSGTLSAGPDAADRRDAGEGRPDAAAEPADAAPEEPDAPPPPTPRVHIVSPAEGAVFVRDASVDGEWSARVSFRVEAAAVSRVELWADGTYFLGEIDAAGLVEYAFRGDGARTIAAIGVDASGEEQVRDEIGIRIEPPTDTSCHAMLDALGLEWTAASPTRGIADPVRVEPYINGVRFRYVSRTEPTAMLMDCELGVRLHQLTNVLAAYGIDEVIHIGIYNYRCIGGGDPDSGTCTPSQHAYARAIDLHAFGLAQNDETYSTEIDWVITSRGDDCPIDSSSEKDRILKEIACAMWADRIFEIVLTPNYNDAHRNHFHVDLTEGSMYLGVGVAGVDPAVPGLGH